MVFLIRFSSINNMLELCRRLADGQIKERDIEKIIDHEDYKFEFERYKGRISKGEYVDYLLQLNNINENNIKNIDLKAHHTYYKDLINNLDLYMEKLSELEKMLNESREEYEKFFKVFGTQIKFGVYNHYGINKDMLKDLLMFYSSNERKLVTLSEYTDKMKDGQDAVYYACGETIDKIDLLPQVEAVKEKNYDIFYLTENIDEFVLQAIMEFKEKKFVNVCANNLDLDSEEEKEKLKKENESNKDMFTLMKEYINNEVENIRLTHKLKNHPVCLTNEGVLSIEMEKVINSMPTDQKVKAKTILEINENHPIANKLKELYENDKDKLKEYTKILYAQARLIEGLPVENPTELSNLICNVIVK
jgi:molecular chaperone HtpG